MPSILVSVDQNRDDSGVNLAAMNNPPTIYEWPTANVALVVAGLAFLVAVGSLMVAYLTYRRAGARVTVKAELGTALAANRPLPVINVTVINSGLAPTTVRNVAFQRKSDWWSRWDQNVVIQAPDGKFVDLPKRVDGNAEGVFLYKRKDLQPYLTTTPGSVIIRAKVTLSTGQARYGNCVRLDTSEPIDDLAVLL